MPEYRVTVGFNAWLLRNKTFTAADDDAARAMKDEFDQWASETMLELAHDNGTDSSDFPDPIITVDRLNTHGVMEDEIYFFRHSQSHPFSTDLLAFTQSIARLTLFAESDYVTGRSEGAGPETVQTDLDWLTAQDDALESLIREARRLTGTENHPPPGD